MSPYYSPGHCPRFWGILVKAVVWTACATLISGSGQPPVGERGSSPELAKISVKGATLHYDGEIHDASVNEVERALASASVDQPITSIVIKSPGGSDAGIRFGEIVFARKLSVTVNEVCVSACANWVALPARELFVPHGAILAFHGGTMNLTDGNERFWRDHLRARGTGEDLIELSVQRIKAMRARELSLFKAIGVSYKILEDSQTRRGRRTMQPWMFTREVLENCYNVRNIKQYPELTSDQTLLDGWAEVVRECPSQR